MTLQADPFPIEKDSGPGETNLGGRVGAFLRSQCSGPKDLVVGLSPKPSPRTAWGWLNENKLPATPYLDALIRKYGLSLIRAMAEPALGHSFELQAENEAARARERFRQAERTAGAFREEFAGGRDGLVADGDRGAAESRRYA